MKEPEAIALNKVSPTWPYVLNFAELMEHKLDQNRHKGNRHGWVMDDPWSLFRRLCDEVIELHNAMAIVGPANAVMECADVANFAMMVADVLDNRPESISIQRQPASMIKNSVETIKMMSGKEIPVFSTTDKLEAIFRKHAEISQKLFGKDSERGPAAPAAHLVKEANELAANPTDISEAADVFNLLMDTVRRSGRSIQDLLNAVDAKLDILPTRKWGQPDANGVIEHIRDDEQPKTVPAVDRSNLCDHQWTNTGVTVLPGQLNETFYWLCVHCNQSMTTTKVNPKLP